MNALPQEIRQREMDLARKNDASFNKLRQDIYGLKKEQEEFDIEQLGSRNRLVGNSGSRTRQEVLSNRAY